MPSALVQVGPWRRAITEFVERPLAGELVEILADRRVMPCSPRRLPLPVAAPCVTPLAVAWLSQSPSSPRSSRSALRRERHERRCHHRPGHESTPGPDLDRLPVLVGPLEESEADPELEQG